MAFKVRQSKYKHLVGAVTKKEVWYPDILSSTASSDFNGVAASALNFSVAGNSAGTVHVLPLTLCGKRNVSALPTIHAHGSAITDMAWSPFHDGTLCVAADNGSAKVFQLPNGFETQEIADLANISITDSSSNLLGHQKRIESIHWHPSAANVIASGALDKTVKIWDVSKGAAVNTIEGPKDGVHSVSWNYDGSLLSAVSKDKKVYIIDPRSKQISGQADAHQGVKPSRVVWLGKLNRLMTTGFSKMRAREFMIWDPRTLGKPLHTQNIDNGTGVLEPMFDVDTSLLFLAGHGDSSIQCLEIEENNKENFFSLTRVTHDMPQRSTCLISKRGVDLMEAEVVRILKLTNKEVIPVSFTVPRRVKSEFQSDLYPDTASTEPAMKASDWFGGANKEPNLTVLRPGVNTKKFWIDETDTTPSAAQTLQTSATPTSSSTASSTPAAPSLSNTVTPVNTPQVEEKKPAYVPKEVKVVRSSKFRHIIGKSSPRREDRYESLKVNVGANSSVIKCNTTYFCFPWQGNGGRVAVIPISQTGRQADQVPFFECGSDCLDFDFSPFNDSLLATCTESAKIQIWKVPQGGLKENVSEAASTLIGHRRRIPTVNFHPSADNILVSTSGDNAIKIWDVSAEKEVLSLDGFVNDPIMSVEWNWTGDLMATSCRDKMMRVFDARSKKVVAETSAHENPRGFKLTWMGTQNKIITAGATQRAERTLALWDMRNVGQPVTTQTIDNGAGVITPYYDENTGVIFTPGKGDGNIKMFELDNDVFEYLTEYQSTVPMAGIAIFPKTVNNVMECEIDRFVKLGKDHAEILSFTVPRTRKELFQDDLFPDTRDPSMPVMSASEWTAGASKPPKMVSQRPPNTDSLSENPLEKTGPKYVFDPSGPKKEFNKDQFLGEYYNRMTNQFGESQNQKLEQDKMQGAESDEWDD